MFNKKAFEVQFNWIFVLIAGAAILLFFTVIVAKQKSISEVSTAGTVLKSVEAIITGAGVSTYTTSIIGIPNSNIEVGCNKVSIGSISKPYQNMVLFAPSLIKGDRLITQTLDFSAPYKATNLLYMTSPQLRYIIIGNNDVAKEINKSMPSELKKDYLIPIIKNENNYKVRFIFFGQVDNNILKNFEKMEDSDATAIKVDGDLSKGGIEFYQKEGLAWALKGKSYYLTKSSLLGAVYSDTLEAYECSMRNAFSRLKLVSQIYGYKTQKLRDGLSGRQAECREFYDKSLSQLRNIDMASSKLDDVSIREISGASESLSNENKELQKYSCPPVY